MKLRLLLLATIASLTFAGIASAASVNFKLNTVTIEGAAFPASQTYIPALPIVGSGTFDFGAGTGLVTLPDYSIVIDVNLDGDDAQLDITDWSQTITSIDGSGNVTSTGGGTTSCTDLGGIGNLVCGSVSPTIAGWPPADGASLLSSAVIDYFLQTITVVDNSVAIAGTVTQHYSYSLVPEPATALLLTGGLVGLGLAGRRSRRA